MSLLSVEDALQRLLTAVDILDSEIIPLETSLGRAISTPIKALLTQPPFNSSAMDGYACKAEDISKTPCRLKLVGEAAAGRGFSGNIAQGEAIRIFTGAPVPSDVDTVVMQEDTARPDETTVEILSPILGGKNIRPAGGDFLTDEIILELGHIMTPAAIALVSAAGYAKISVIRRPRVAILSTGDELVPAGTLPGPDQIVASNAYGLAAILQACNVENINLGIAKDTKDAIKKALATARAQKADLILSSGGVSVGDYDLVQSVFQEEGMELNFWKIAIRPGKPLMFGSFPDGMLAIGLPGNPVSCLTTCQLFVVPFLEKISGRPHALDIHCAKLTESLKANGARRHFIRGILRKNNDGSYKVTPAISYDSSLLKIMAHSNCFIVQHENSEELKAGDECTVFIPKGGL